MSAGPSHRGLAEPAVDCAAVSAANYSAVETLRDGRRADIRSLEPSDEAALLSAIGRTSDQSMYRRFFGVKRDFSPNEIAFFLNVDFVTHVALVAEVDEAAGPMIVGGGRYVVAEPGIAELAFAVTDAYQGKGLGTALLRHLTKLARARGLRDFVADVLPENSAMLTLFERSGLPLSRMSSGGVVHVTLSLS
jgi:GNAT superfamily N-acetyltransferase